jgi:hypothetical protein
VLFRFFTAVFLEIAAWNVLVLSASLFLAQGIGIVMFFLSRRRLSTLMRFCLGVLAVIIAVSPPLNLAVLGALVILGIMENWLPLRRLKN